MSKRLYLLRHAKSSWEDAQLPDHDRPLAGRGRRAAAALAGYITQYGLAADLVLCSTALRARETWERIEPALAAGAVRFERELYGASAQTLLERLHSVSDATSSVLLIGHNPAIEELALGLARPSTERREVETKYPTGGLAILEFPGWRLLDRGDATLVTFVRPRDLAT